MKNSKVRSGSNSSVENSLSFKMKNKAGINITKSYLFTCFKEPNPVRDD